jgi:hypothetical protein
MPNQGNAKHVSHRRHSAKAQGSPFRQDADDGDYDLRDALVETVVREASFSEFRAALMHYRQCLH